MVSLLKDIKTFMQKISKEKYSIPPPFKIFSRSYTDNVVLSLWGVESPINALIILYHWTKIMTVLVLSRKVSTNWTKSHFHFIFSLTLTSSVCPSSLPWSNLIIALTAMFSFLSQLLLQLFLFRKALCSVFWATLGLGFFQARVDLV